MPKVATPENNDPPKAATDMIDILNELSQTDGGLIFDIPIQRTKHNT